MGYNILSYAVDYAKLKSAIGSEDHSLYHDIKNNPSFIGCTGQNYPGLSKTKEALKQLIFGLPKEKDIVSSAYLYALIGLVNQTGKKLPGTHEIQLDYETDLINKYLKDDFKVDVHIADELLNDAVQLGLPLSGDKPYSGLLSKSQLLVLQAKFEGIHISEEELEELLQCETEKEMVYDSIHQIKDNVNFCLSESMSMISFCH
ncbi:hypothetical protein ACE38W_12050 [Chitinophaga sp. Hz27]|uniref:DUF7691 family protein n=1 Tax=Chitinophaga sp. Hz27 TaxID=3347169 RepID=UPI0035E2CE2F